MRVSPNEVELVRLGRVGRQFRLGVAAAALLVLVAVAKPWLLAGGAPAAAPGPPREVVPGLSVSAAAGSSPAAPAAVLCQGQDGWLVVADDVEFGQPIRSWVAASVEYSAGQPLGSTIPTTVVISKALDRLGFCLPASMAEPVVVAWSGTLWRLDETTDPAGWQRAAQVAPAPGSLGAIAKPVDSRVTSWPPGEYVLEARFAGSADEAWLGLVIRPSP